MQGKSWLLGAATACGLSWAISVSAAQPPALDVVLKPLAEDGKVVRLEVDLRIEAPQVEAGNTLLKAPVVLVGTPMAGYGAASIRASDAQGELPLKVVDEAPTPTGTYRRWTAARATHGDVRVHYGTAPRAVDASTRNGPLFDLRAEAGGIVGSGNYFYALPDTKTPYAVSLKWDLSGAPTGWRGVWSLGEGEQHAVVPAEVLSFSFYAAGPVNSYPPARDTNFALYWLAKPPFDTAALAQDTQKLYGFMSRFFDDASAPYRVFVRGNPYPAGGGTALAKSFMFGYGPGGETASGGDVQMLLAHEMAHNWPKFNADEDHALTAWYSEGTAEYYSAVLALRSGAISLEKFQKVVGEMVKGYYTNPFLTLSNQEAGKIFWKDPRAQRVPYGRGLVYFLRLDAMIRAKTGGAKRLDDLVLEVQRRQKAGEVVGLVQWREMVGGVLGEAGTKDFDAMIAGQRMTLKSDVMGPCFKVSEVKEQPFELGFDEMSLGVVSKLRKDSAAAKAGVEDGDRIVAMTKLAAARDEGLDMSLTLQRGEKQLKVVYPPRAAAVDSARIERVPAVAGSACRI
ncbi:hypothetical protein [Pelomonas sp. KK5]|uniref:hypothetical protein n=1 Tax=Pelomonas sp. KK5 TaxID=1855730 RepID=UPI00097C0C5D|nr:hypothetical protein [Pelomonas sp. KK5]